MTRLVPIGIALLLAAAPAGAQERPVPYWASIAASAAILRAGPDRSYPALWVYKRKDLPVKVLQLSGAWRRVQEQDGTSGWMQAMLLSARRTGVVVGAVRTIRDAPQADGRMLWQAEPGVIGRLSRCESGWCRIQIGEKRGYIEQSAVWGTDPGETVR